MNDPLFRFTMRATKKDRTGYMFTQWDKAQRMTVIATTQQEAANKAEHMLLTLSRDYCWTFIFDSSDEIYQEQEV